jgi:hypothetical protein
MTWLGIPVASSAPVSAHIMKTEMAQMVWMSLMAIRVTIRVAIIEEAEFSMCDPCHQPHIWLNLANPAITPSKAATAAAEATIRSPPWTTLTETSNLTDVEKELVHWHCHLVHFSFFCIQFLMWSGTLQPSHVRRLFVWKNRQRTASGTQQSTFETVWMSCNRIRSSQASESKSTRDASSIAVARQH